MTIDEAKNIYANKQGHTTWSSLITATCGVASPKQVSELAEGIALIYASQYQKKPRLKPKKFADKIVSRTDDQGNMLICKHNGVRVIVTLKLKQEQKHRRIGVINIERKTIEVRRNKDKHLMRVNNSYGFNHKLLEDAKLFDKVRLIDEVDEWLIPKDWILKNGSFLHFKNVGFERQIFVNQVDMMEFLREPKL